MDRGKMQYEGLKWLFELDMINHPQVINHIKFNILMVSKRIKDVDLLLYREQKSILILLHYTWIGRKFSNKKAIASEVQEMMSQLLPSFKFRVTDDPKIMDLAIERVKKALTGGSNESSTINKSSDVQSETKPVDAQDSSNQSSGTSSPESNSKESSEVGSKLLETTSTDDSKKEQ